MGDDERTEQRRHWVITVGFLAASYALALAVSDLGVMLSIVGATGSTIVSYILPGLCYYRLHPRPHLQRNVALMQLVLGCIIMPVALVIIFSSMGS